MSNNNFKIDKINNFYSEVFEVPEVSEIGNIIREITRLKNNKVKIAIAIKPYSIYDKIKKNKINKSLSTLIVETHAVNYDLIEKALSILELENFDVRQELFELYRTKYLELLSKMNIDIDNEKLIAKNSETIFIKINEIIHNEIFSSKKSDITFEKQIKYVYAISAYVFYRCKILLTLE